MNTIKKYLWVMIPAILLFSACDPGITFEEQQTVDRQLIEDYIATNNLEGDFTPEGVFYSVSKEGVGNETPNIYSTIQIVYTGTLLDGTVFDHSDGFPTAFQLGGLIRGWQIGLQEFTRESEGIMVIPSRLAYGENGSGSIPPNAVIRFDIELIDFIN